MERDGDQGPDAASIKPVSSLRAKFETIQHQYAGDSDKAKGRAPSGGLLEPGKQTNLTRVSLDMPRSASPWSVQSNDRQHNQPTTPGPQPPESPTRSNHKRPMSMLIQSSPQLTPAVQVNSPKSPPRSLFARTNSRSPERVDSTAFAKVKDLVSQHSSKSSTRAPTPRLERSDTASIRAQVESPLALETASTNSRPKSPIPPPVNRADKPKIPAKPQHITSSQDSRLGARPLAFLNERRVSPFSTPPSSDDDQAPSSSKDSLPAARRSIELLNRIATTASPDSLPSMNTSRSADPRMTDFSAPNTASQRSDPRQLGFSTGQPQASAQPSRDTRNEPAPTRTVPPVETSARDPRELGFGGGTPISKHAPVLPQQRRSPPRLGTVPRSSPTRDPRQYGFGGSMASVPSTPVEGPKPELPQRSTSRVPPPRPSEDSKHPVYAPAISRTSVRIPSHPPASMQVRRSEDLPRHTVPVSIPAPANVNFPPPPKRNTFIEEEPYKSESLDLPTCTPPRRSSFDANTQRADDSDEAEDAQPEPSTSRQDYPDGTNTNRRPPILDPDQWQIPSKTDGKAFDICGRLLCIASYYTRVFNLETNEEVLTLNHGETVKTTAVAFKPGPDIKSEGKRIWIGNNIGDLQEIDLETRASVAQSSAHNRREIMKIIRYQKNLWTLDEDGKLFVWPADESGVPNLKYSHVSHKLLKPPTYAMGVLDTLWVASGKEIRVYRPGHESTFNVLKTPLSQPNTGDVTCGTHSEDSNKVYIGQTDGKITIYSLKDYSCVAHMKVSDYKINAMTIVGSNLWAVYKTGKVYVYDITLTPWKVKKDWKAHQGPATGILLDPSSVWLLGRLQVATTGHDQYVRLWDGMLEDDWIESSMHDRDAEYCTFRDVRAAVVTWNAGATFPLQLKSDFISDAIYANEPDPPEILVFGFQEVVDLEDRAVTAKSIFGFGKKKEKSSANDQHHQSRVYREWRDYLAQRIRKYLPHHDYMELHTSSLVGLFSCIFIRSSEHHNISRAALSDVKCGMGGHYGNKGALLSRFVLDSSSLIFINCHLAAGQSQTSHRNNDVATILESESLPPENDLETRTSLYVGGGNGRQILDHEICILNGDLNYRIDTMPRDLVIKHIANNDLSKLLERDQLNVSRRRVAGFRLAPFTELPLTFPPTYKYDVGINFDRYDSSEKKRSPAWCDRILYRSHTPSRVKQLEYKRHENVFYSDHRPVSAVFRITVKKVDEARRKKVLKSAYTDFEVMRKKMLEEGCVRYLVGSFGLSKEEARKLIRGVVK